MSDMSTKKAAKSRRAAAATLSLAASRRCGTPAGTARRRAALLVTTALVSALWAVDAAAQPTQNALPTGGAVAAGQSTIASNGANMVITQGTQRSAINWNSYNIGANASVTYVQPNAQAISLNRVVGNDPSQIFGRLTANGQVWLSNPNGILFGRSARIDVAGLVAATANITDQEFMTGTGQFRFEQAGRPGAAVVNEGEITIRDAGLAAFVAPGVRNSGTINARLGRVALGGGNTFTLDLYGDRLINLAIDDPATQNAVGADGSVVQAGVTQSGRIMADGGRVQLSANVARGVVDNVIRSSGEIVARAVVDQNGDIVLDGGSAGGVEVTGTIDASGRAPTQRGGRVRITGERVHIAPTVTVDVTGDIAGGGIEMAADIVALEGALRAGALTGRGGSVGIQFNQLYVASNTALVDASGGTAGGGGAIAVVGGPGSVLLSSGVYVATGLGAGQVGGTVDLLAGNVGLYGTVVDASGDAGGGIVRIGGDFHGQGAPLNAVETFVDAGTAILADAITAGDGGRVAVWSDVHTEFWGTIGVRGGAVAGDGGLAEVSGLETLAFRGMAYAAAPHGANGGLLLDPRDIYIDNIRTISTTIDLGNPNPAIPSSSSKTFTVLVPAPTNFVVTSSDVTYGMSANGNNTGIARLATITLTSPGGSIGGPSSTFNVAGSAPNAATGTVTILSFTPSGPTGNGTWSVTVNNNTATSGRNIHVDSLALSLTGTQGSAVAPSVSFGQYAGQDVTVTPASIVALLNVGTNVFLEANRDIEVRRSVVADSGSTGSLRLEAGRSILVGLTSFGADGIVPDSNLQLNTGNRNLSLIANSANASVNEAERGTGIAVIAMATGSTLNAGTGQVLIDLQNGGAGVNNASGDITLSNVTGGSVLVRNNGPTAGSDILRFDVNSTITAGTLGLVATNGNVGAAGAGINFAPTSSSLLINSAGSATVNVTGSGAGFVTIAGSVAAGLTLASSRPLQIDTVTVNPGAITATGLSVGGTAAFTLTGATAGGVSLTQSAIGTFSAGTLTVSEPSGGGSVLLDAATNHVTDLGAVTVIGGDSDFRLTDADLGLTINGAVNVADQIVIRALGGTGVLMTLAGGTTITSGDNGDAIVLQSTGDFTNVAGAGVFTTAAGGRYLIFLHDPSDVLNEGGLTAGNFYGLSYPTAPASSFGSRFVFETQPTLTVTGSNHTVTYGDATPSLSYTVTGIRTDDLSDPQVYTGAPTIGSAYVAGSSVSGSPYVVTVSQNTLTSPIGYLIDRVDGSITVNTAALTVAANNDSRVYNGLAYSGGNGVQFSGFVNGETPAVLGGTLGYSGTSQGATNVGNYAITPGGLTSGNYTLSYQNAQLNITPAALTITAGDATRILASFDRIVVDGPFAFQANPFVGNRPIGGLGGAVPADGGVQALSAIASAAGGLSASDLNQVNPAAGPGEAASCAAAPAEDIANDLLRSFSFEAVTRFADEVQQCLQRMREQRALVQGALRVDL
jgi:filamentous hemagglutinin family protein